ncbi:MAG: c-type cytochrome [Aestuariibacter sp.]
MKKPLIALVIAGLLSTPISFANEAKSEKQAKAAIQYRQALLQVIRSNMGALGAMAKGHIPFDAQKMEKNGMRIEQLATMMPDYFAIDTSAYKMPTDAKADIWQNHEDFTGKINDLISAARNLQVVASDGDESQFKGAIGQVGRACKGCHDEYKEE